MEENARRWRGNLRAMKERVRDRLCAAQAHSSLRQSQQRTGVVRGAALGRAKTGIVVARVFKGNVVFSRIAKNLRQRERAWRKMSISDSFRNLIAGAFGGAILVGGSSAHAEAHEAPQGFLEELASRRKFFKGRGAATIDDDLKEKICEDSPTIRVLRAIAVPVLANVCHVFMHGLNHTEVYGLEKLEKALLHRPEGKGLITLSNHVAAMDDPLVTASLLSPQILLHEGMLRWTLCATDRCFTSVSKSIFFTSLKVLPVSRGKGIYQEGMDLAVEKLNHGDWVHIFPEGSRSRDGGKTLGSVKRGVGRLVMDATETPVIIPFMHEGMQEVLPIGSKFPHICKKVTVLVGDPIHVDDLLARCKDQELTTDALYDAVAQRVEERMHSMKGELQQLVTNERLARERDRKLYLARRASGIWERVDWEMEGFSLHSDDETIDQQQQQREYSDISYRHAARTDHPIHSNWEDRALGNESPSIASRLRAFSDPAALVSFAARGIAWKTREFKYGVDTWTARFCGNQGLGF